MPRLRNFSTKPTRWVRLDSLSASVARKAVASCDVQIRGMDAPVDEDSTVDMRMVDVAKC